MARLTRNLIGGTAIMTANHLDFFLKDNISTALRTINLYLHGRQNLGSHVTGMVPISRFYSEQTFNGVLAYEKFQITNHKYQTNHNDQNSKFETYFLFWSLNIGI
jgi:hypothetical protein